MRKFLCYLLGISASAVLILSIFVTALDISATDYGFYEREYQKLSQPKNIGISQDELMKVTRKLVGYMRGQEENLDIKAKIMGKNREVFAKRDKEHMVDVRNLYVFWLWFSRAGLLFALVSAAVIVLSMRRQATKVLSRCFLWASGGFAAVVAAIGVWIAIDFTSFWISFHHLFFTNDLWILDPATSVLIQMVPEQFFFDICIKILSIFAAIMAGLLALCIANVIFRSWKRRELLAIRIREEQASETMAEAVIEKFALRQPKQSLNELVTGDPDFYEDTLEDADEKETDESGTEAFESEFSEHDESFEQEQPEEFAEFEESDDGKD